MADELKPAIDKLRAWAGQYRQSARDNRGRDKGEVAQALADEKTATIMDKAADLLEKQ